MAGGQRHNLLMFDVEVRRSANQERTSTLSNECHERRVDFVFCTGTQNDKLHAQAGRRLLDIAHLGFGGYKIRIDEHCDRIGPGNHLMQQAKSLCLKPLVELNHPGQIAARPVEAGYEAEPYRVSAGVEHNRNCHRRLFCNLRHLSSPNEHCYTTANQVRHQRRGTAVLTLDKAVVDHNVLAFMIAQVSESIPECSNRPTHRFG